MGWKSPSYSAQFNLKGKKVQRLACNCCTLYNHKELHAKKLAEKEIRETKQGKVDV